MKLITRHYLINSLANWREGIRRNDVQKAYNAMKYMCGITKAETLKMIRLYYDTDTSGMNIDI